MANGLTESDMSRLRLGFGVRPDTDSRRRAAAAGIAPLTTSEKIRRDWGWGPSSREEQKAFQAAEVIERGGPISEMPVEYGGRPTGTSRRALRMQAEYDEARRAIQQIENEALERQERMRESERADTSLRLRLMEYQDKNDREDAIKQDGMNLMISMRGATLPDGTAIRPINPMDDDAISRLESAAITNPYGLEDTATREVWERKYSDAQKFAEQKLSTIQKQEEQQQSWLIGQQEEAATLGIDTAKFFTTDPQTGAISKVDQLGLSKAIGEAKRKDLENKKREIARAELDEETKGQARSILDEINKTDSEIRKANFNAGRTKGTIRDENIAQAEFLRSERDVLVERFNSLLPQKPAEGAAQPPSFDSVEAAESANLPKGTIVVIGGRRARID